MTTNPESTEIPHSPCHGCGDQRCAVGQVASASAVEGPRLVFAAFACFLVPLLLAIGGATLCRFSPTAQLFGATTGLTLGMVIWGLVARLFATSEEAA